MEAMGGQEAMNHAQFLRFDWAVERGGKEVAHVHHLWDRSTGRYRVEWKTKDGKNVQVLFDVDTKAGKVWIDGKPASPEDENTYLGKAYGRFINDSYWLLMPCKLLDPHVNLDYQGEKEVDGKLYNVVHVTFDHVGLTPGDQYWAFLNKRTQIMDRWAYFLESDKGTASLDSATVWDWKDWQDVGGGVKLARDRVQVGGDEPHARIFFPVVAVLSKVDPKVFEKQDVSMPGEAKP